MVLKPLVPPLRVFRVRHRDGDSIVSAHTCSTGMDGTLIFGTAFLDNDGAGIIERYQRMFAARYWTDVEEVPVPPSSGLSS